MEDAISMQRDVRGQLGRRPHDLPPHQSRSGADTRTVDDVYNAIADILPLTSPAECSNYFAQAGYAQPQTITL
jgi:hypothetical protein